MSGLAVVRERLALALPGDPARPLLACLIAMVACLGVIGGFSLVLLGDERREQGVSLGNTLTLEIPAAAASTARIEMSLALLRQTSGIQSVRLLDQAETARLLEPWLGPAAATDTLPVPRLVDVKIDPGAAIDLGGLSAKLSSIVPGAQLEDHRLPLGGFRRAALRADILIAIGLAALGVLACIAAMLLTRARLALHRRAFELFHLLGASDAAMIRPIEAEVLLEALLGGAIGAVGALVMLVVVGGALLPVELGAPGIADWRLWSVAVGMTLILGLLAMGSARFAVLRRLARMP